MVVFTTGRIDLCSAPNFTPINKEDYYILVGFGRACAPVRCAHPSFGAHYHAKRGAARPPAHRSFAGSYLPPKNFPEARTRATKGIYLPIGLSCTLLSYIASYCATLHPPDVHPNELRCTLLSYAVPLRYAAFN